MLWGKESFFVSSANCFHWNFETPKEIEIEILFDWISVFPKGFLLLQDIQAKNLPDQTIFYQTEKNWVKNTYKMLIILCLWYLIS
jgi:hypothetical protein